MDEADIQISSAQLFGAVLRAFRRKGVRDVAARLPVSWGHLARMERGEQPVPPDLVPLLDAAYQAGGALVKLSELLARDEARSDLESKLLRLGTFTSNPLNIDEEDMERRSLLRLLSVLGPGAVIPASTIDALHSGLRQITGDALDSSVDDWEQIAWDYAQGVWTDLSGSRSADLAADIHDLSRRLALVQTSAERAGLLRVYAQLSAFLAIDLPLVAGPRACWRAWSAARAAADASGDRDLAVWVRAEEAAESFYMKRPGSAVDNLVDEAIHMANGHPSLGLAQALKNRVRRLADQGNAESATRAVGELIDVYAALPSSVTSESISVWGMSPADVQWAEAWAHLKRGDPKPAVPLIEQAIANAPVEKVGGRANLGLVRAWTLVQDRDVTEGLDHAVQVAQPLPVTPARRRIIGEVLAALPEKARALPAARELRALAAPAAA
jgi:hypothetical protein